MKIVLNNNEYELIKDNGNAFILDDIKDLCTEYFNDFDYILGDYSYDKLRLKGFFSDDNKLAKEYNKFSSLDDYVKMYCAYGCKYFVLKKNSLK